MNTRMKKMTKMKVVFCGTVATLLIGGVVILAGEQSGDPKDRQENQVTVKLHFDADLTTQVDTYPLASQGDLSNEEYLLQEGKTCRVNVGLDNFYSCLVPAYARGYDIFGNDNSLPGSFSPLVVELPDDVDENSVTLKFVYSGSDPANVSEDYKPAPGSMRIWSKNGDVSRKKTEVAEGGNYVVPSKEYPLSIFRSVRNGKYVKLYMEGVDLGKVGQTETVTVEIKKDDVIGTDSIAVYFFRMSMEGAFHISQQV